MLQNVGKIAILFDIEFVFWQKFLSYYALYFDWLKLDRL